MPDDEASLAVLSEPPKYRGGKDDRLVRSFRAEVVLNEHEFPRKLVLTKRKQR